MIRLLVVALLRALSLIAVLAAGLIVAGDNVVAQQGGTAVSSSSEATVSTASDGSSNARVAAVPAAFSLPETHFVGSVLHKRTVWFERFDTDHDIDGSGGEDREIFGSHYVWDDTFRVRIPSSYADKPEDVFGVGFLLCWAVRVSQCGLLGVC